MKRDYNEPHYWENQKRYLDNEEVSAKVWNLKPMMTQKPIEVYTVNGYKKSVDLLSVSLSVIVVGTELQRFHKFKEMLDEHGWQTSGDYATDLKPEWEKLYKDNNNLPIIINKS